MWARSGMFIWHYLTHIHGSIVHTLSHELSLKAFLSYDEIYFR